MNGTTWIALVLLAAGLKLSWRALFNVQADPKPTSWEQREAALHRVYAEAAREAGLIVHRSPHREDEVGELLEFPTTAGWDEHAILVTVAEIESL